jgi:hypothetical protein
MPGVWDVEDGNVKRVIDIKKGPGRDGATIKDMGYEPGAFTLVGQLLSADHWDTLQSIFDTLHATQKATEREPVYINHPKLAFLGIRKVYITELEIPRLDNGIMTTRIRVLEWTDKPKAIGKAKASTANLEAELANTSEWLKSDFNAVVAAKKLNFDEKASANEQFIADEMTRRDEFARAQARGEVPLFAKINTPPGR